MQKLRDAPYSLLKGDTVKAKIRAENSHGYGTQSDLNLAGAIIEIKPSKMTAVTRGSLTSET